MAERLEVSADLASSHAMGRRLRNLLNSVAPDAIHALRIQYEAISAAIAGTGLPLAVSTWGSDLITTAKTTQAMDRYTKRTLRHTDLLFSDCERDLTLADRFGLRPNVPKHIVPGNFGIDFSKFPAPQPTYLHRFGLRSQSAIVYPRGLRGCINHELVVEAFRALASRGVDYSYLGIGLDSVVDVGQQISGRFVCTPQLPYSEMLKIASVSSVTVSPSTSDGLPNSILEGMAGGAIPVCGDLESLRELERMGAVIVWCDPVSLRSICEGIERAIDLATDPSNRAANAALVRRVYGTHSSKDVVRDAYQTLISTYSKVEPK